MPRRAKRSAQPYEDIVVCFGGTLSQTRKALTAMIKNGGGRVVTALSGAVDAFIASAGELDARTNKVCDAEAFGTPILSEDFLDAAETAGNWKDVDMDKYKLEDSDAYLALTGNTGGGAGGGAGAGTTKAKAKKTKAAPKKRARKTAAAAAPAAKAGALEGIVFCMGGTLSKTRAAMKKLIESHGGVVASTITKKVTHFLCAEEEFDAKTSKVIKAESMNVPTVAESFLDEAIAAGDWEQVKLADHEWQDDDPAAAAAPAPAAADDEDDDESSDEDEEEDSKMVKRIKKGKVPNDMYIPDNVTNIAHVYEANGVVYSATLNQTNMKENNNKFYMIQVLQSDTGSQYWAWNRWGRVGVPGQHSLKAFSSADGAIAAFKAKFTAKTKNSWDNRANFVKYDGKYHLIEVNYDDDDDDAAASKKKKKGGKIKIPDSKLDERVQELVKLICDISFMKQQMEEIGYDAKKMPLGKISQKMIREGYQVLTQISQVLKGEARGDLYELSGAFFTVIPHNFGFRKMREFVINTPEKLKKKIEMVESLADVALATKLLKAGDLDVNPIDANFAKLKCSMTPLEAKDEEREMIVDYVAKTHAPTHSSYSLEVEEVFKLQRDGEDKVFDKVGGKLDNHQLLWHGSRRTNFCGILSQGLRIAPPEAPVTGYMFGKGVYFADMVSKSANYCFTTPTNNTGLLLLCEVALGKPRPLKHSDYYAANLPKGYSSTWGQGKTAPDPAGTVTLPDGVKVPKGKYSAANVDGSSLLYNEFIVYDTAQIRMKYLIRTKFNYKQQAGWW